MLATLNVSYRSIDTSHHLLLNTSSIANMSEPPVPPPRHVSRVSTTKSTTASSSTIAGKDVGKKTWKDSMKDKGKVWGGKAYEKSWKWSDAIGGRVNDYAGKVSLRNRSLENLTFTELLLV